ncbi:MAG: hypothetical protein AABM31_04370 [Actinomycetota bacterium]
MSEFEQPGRLEREPSVEDVRQLMGASTPHFALHLRNRIRSLIAGLPEGHPARVEGEREIARLDEVAEGSERRGAQGNDEPAMPSLRAGHVPESAGPSGAA